MCLAQGHNTVAPVRLRPTAPQSRVKHSATVALMYVSEAYLVCTNGMG